MSFQPSELAKPALILFLAFFLADRTKSIDDWRHTLLPAVIPSALFAVLIALQPDLGTALVCLGVTAAILYIAGVRLRYFIYSLVPIVPALCYLLIAVPWRLQRVIVFLFPGRDPQGAGFHINQSLIAVGTGGVTGLGLMEGKQKLFYLPEPHTDFIYAVSAEELGLIGAVFIALLFFLFAWRGFRAGLRSHDTFGRFLACGVTSMIVLQAFFNMSVVLALLPTKGIPLPFISYGGSSLFVMLSSVGVLLNITQQAE